jgi:hypothetical protein
MSKRERKGDWKRMMRDKEEEIKSFRDSHGCYCQGSSGLVGQTYRIGE